MIQKASIVEIVDKSIIKKANVFHIYKGFKHRFGWTGNFVKLSARVVAASASSKKGTKLNGVIVRTSKHINRHDGSIFFCKMNAVVSLKKRLTPRGKELVGPVNKVLARKRFLSSFPGVF